MLGAVVVAHNSRSASAEADLEKLMRGYAVRRRPLFGKNSYALGSLRPSSPSIVCRVSSDSRSGSSLSRSAGVQKVES